MMRTWAVAGIALAVCTGALVVLALIGPWKEPVQALVATVTSLALVGVVSGLAWRRGWDGDAGRVTRIAAGLALGWFLVFGILLAGAGAPPEPYASDVGPTPWMPVMLDRGQGTRIAVGVVWVLAAGAGIAAMALGGRTRRAGA